MRRLLSTVEENARAAHSGSVFAVVRILSGCGCKRRSQPCTESECPAVQATKFDTRLGLLPHCLANAIWTEKDNTACKLNSGRCARIRTAAEDATNWRCAV